MATPFQTVETKLTDVEHVCDSLKIFRFEPADGGEVPFTFTPGQFVQFMMQGADGKPVIRSYSIASSPGEKGILEFVIKILPDGTCTQLLDAMTLGDTCTMRGPLGNFTLQDTDAPKGFIAAGTGIGPIMSMVRHLRDTKSKADQTLLYGVGTEACRAYAAELSEWTGTYTPVVSREEVCPNGCSEGHVTDHLDVFTKPEETEFYICGQPDMVKDVRTNLEHLGATNIQFEAY